MLAQGGLQERYGGTLGLAGAAVGIVNRSLNPALPRGRHRSILDANYAD